MALNQTKCKCGLQESRRIGSICPILPCQRNRYSVECFRIIWKITCSVESGKSTNADGLKILTECLMFLIITD